MSEVRKCKQCGAVLANSGLESRTGVCELGCLTRPGNGQSQMKVKKIEWRDDSFLVSTLTGRVSESDMFHIATKTDGEGLHLMEHSFALGKYGFTSVQQAQDYAQEILEEFVRGAVDGH